MLTDKDETGEAMDETKAGAGGHFVVCERDLVEDCGAPDGDMSRCADDDCPLREQGFCGAKGGSALHRKRRDCVDWHPAAPAPSQPTPEARVDLEALEKLLAKGTQWGLTSAGDMVMPREDAELACALRNAAPELIRIARRSAPTGQLSKEQEATMPTGPVTPAQQSAHRREAWEAGREAVIGIVFANQFASCNEIAERARALPLPESALPPRPSDSVRPDEAGSPASSDREQSEAPTSREAEGAGPTRADQRVRELVGLSPDMQEIADENAYYRSDRQATLKDAKEGVAPELGVCDFWDDGDRPHGRTVVCKKWRPVAAPAPVETREPLTKEKP